MLIHVLYFLLCSFLLIAKERGSSAPFISGDSFRLMCDFTFDELGKKLDPLHVQAGDKIFVKTDYVGEFFEKIHPKIVSKYLLVTHNSDHSIPGDYSHLLQDEKIIAWFGLNVDGFKHPKLHPIPIGLANRCWPHGNVCAVAAIMKKVDLTPKKNMLYMNFTASTYPQERNSVAALFKKESYCVVAKPKKFRKYLMDLISSKFVLSPRGNGLDSHRTWEALLMGAIPIVRTSDLDPMYKDLPVVIVQEWEEINLDFLIQKGLEIDSTVFDRKKIYFDYWRDIINFTASRALSQVH